MESLVYLKELGLLTVPAREFTYEQMNAALKYAGRLRTKGRGFNLRTDGGFRSRNQDDLPFKRNFTLTGLKNIMERYKDSLTYIIFETPDDTKLYFNGTCCLDETGPFVAEINYTDQGANRDTMKIGKNRIRIDIPPQFDCEPVLLQIRGDMMSRGLYKTVEISAFEEGQKIVYWQIRNMTPPGSLQNYMDICKMLGIKHIEVK